MRGFFLLGGVLLSCHAQAWASSITAGLQAADRGRWQEARAGMANDALGAKLYTWLRFSRTDAGPEEYTGLVQFIRGNPDWPGMDSLRGKAERTMPRGLRSADVTAWFSDFPPLTAPGLDRYLEALIAQGRQGEAKAVLSDWWARATATRDEQRDIYLKYGALLGREAHRLRLDTLLFARQYTNARAIAQVLGNGYPELAEARIALAEERPDVAGLIATVPRVLQYDPGLLYERLRWRRRANEDAGAMEILAHAPPPDKIANPKDWWVETHILARRLIEKGDYAGAYRLVSRHFQEEGFEYTQAEWLAGWLALRFLDKPQQALAHFEALHLKVKNPVSKSRAAYWAGLASKKLGAADNARLWFQDAARYQTVFYGQMAGAELGRAETLPNAAPPVLTAQDKQEFAGLDLIRAAGWLAKAGLRRDASRFINAFVTSRPEPKSYRYAAEFASALGMYSDAVRIAKKATEEGLFLTAQSYPVVPVADTGVEPALIHAVIRQESLFDEGAQSPAGALGLMQLMPATAQETAGKLGIAHSQGWLTQRPQHNIQLGSAYLARLLTRYGGSYPLAIAAYNAGPGRVDKWLALFGDPRIGPVHMVDWIEMIPVYETRNYVQRVLENVHVYRLRLREQGRPAVQLVQNDMNTAYYLSLR